MKRDEVLNFASGRELDKLAAGKVMRWTSLGEIVEGIETDLIGVDPSSYPAQDVVPRYSTEISAAFLIWDYMIFQSNQGLYLHFKNNLAELMGNQIYPSWHMAKIITISALLAVMDL